MVGTGTEKLIIDTQKTLSVLTYSITILVPILLFLIIYYLINIGNRHIEKDRRIQIDLKFVIKLMIFLVAIYILNIIFRNYPILGDTLWSIVIAAILAYVINPLVNFFEKKGIKRVVGLIIVYVGFIVIVGLLLFIVIPNTIAEVSKLFANLPDTISNWSDNVDEYLNKFRDTFNAAKGADQTYDPVSDVTNSLQVFTNKFSRTILSYLETLPSKFTLVASKIIRFVFTLVLSFYFVLDKDEFVAKIRDLVPSKYREDASYLARRINEALMDFVKGRLLMAVFVGAATAIVLLIFRVNFAIIVGLLTMIGDIIPYIGPFIAFVPAVLFAAMDSPIKALIIAACFVIIQWLENNILAGKLIGGTTGLHPVVVLLSILVGGGIFGVAGMILSVPVVSIIIILIDFARMKLNEKRTHPVN